MQKRISLIVVHTLITISEIRESLDTSCCTGASILLMRLTRVINVCKYRVYRYLQSDSNTACNLLRHCTMDRLAPYSDQIEPHEIFIADEGISQLVLGCVCQACRSFVDGGCSIQGVAKAYRTYAILAGRLSSTKMQRSAHVLMPRTIDP